MNVGSLFSGIGGIEIGFEREGFETSWFVENNLYCQAVLRKNFPEVKVYGDIKEIDFARLPRVDILTGGFPCQDISVAGKRKGMVGERSGLWSEFSRAISEIRPSYVVVENVPNLVNLGLEKVLTDLSKIGYDCEWFTLRASQFGAIHRRERIFIIAYPHSERGSWRSEENKGQTKNDATSSRRINPNRHDGGFKSNTKPKTPRRKITSTTRTRFITNDWGQRIQGFRSETMEGKQGFSRFKDVRRVEDLFNRPNLPQPLVRRSGNGVSNRMDRTKSIGNAVVPVVAQFIARQIKEKEGGQIMIEHDYCINCNGKHSIWKYPEPIGWRHHSKLIKCYNKPSQGNQCGCTKPQQKKEN